MVGTMPTVADIATTLRAWAPLAAAADWDNVGLLLGDPTAPADRILTCLTITPPVVAEALADRRQMIITHHPILFRGVKRLTDDQAESRVVADLIRGRVAVYSAHTAYDNAPGGINDQIGQILGVSQPRPLRVAASSGDCKVVVFAPDADLAPVMDAMFAAGAGRIGQYRECSYRLSGTGSFRATEGANPTVGSIGSREEVAEWRLEVVCSEASLAAVLRAMRDAHSYEEPAFDVYPLRTTAGHVGAGRYGELNEPITLGAVAERVRSALRCGPVAVVGEFGRPVRRLAWACGAAGEFLDDAMRVGADLFLTGELRFHDALRAQARGVALAIPGHYATERFAMESLAARLKAAHAECDVTASAAEREPFQWV